MGTKELLGQAILTAQRGLPGMVRNWVNSGEDRRVELAFPQADQSVIIKALPGDLPVVLRALAEYEQLRPQIRYAPGAAGEGGSAKGLSSSRLTPVARTSPPTKSTWETMSSGVTRSCRRAGISSSPKKAPRLSSTTHRLGRPRWPPLRLAYKIDRLGQIAYLSLV